MKATARDGVAVISRDGANFVIDGRVVADRFGLTVEQFRAALKAADIVTTCETGEGEDAGSTRLTFRRDALLWRFVLKADGSVEEDPVLLGHGQRGLQKDIR
jgi:hypothetical protein